MSKNFLNPSETASAVINMGITRGNEKSSFKILVSGFFAGVFIALAGIGQLSATQTLAQNFDPGFAKFLGACIFPVGLMLCVFTGASLFTGNSLLTLSFLTKNLNFFNLVRNLSLVWIGNFWEAYLLHMFLFMQEFFYLPQWKKHWLGLLFQNQLLVFQNVFSADFCVIFLWLSE